MCIRDSSLALSLSLSLSLSLALSLSLSLPRLPETLGLSLGPGPWKLGLTRVRWVTCDQARGSRAGPDRNPAQD
eukprot:7221956-Alexandrium_andersonii.AAC.1